MAFTTFTGPIRSGTVRENAGMNTGLVILAQSVTVLPGATSPAPSLFLPPYSQILDIYGDVFEAFDGTTPTATMSLVSPSTSLLVVDLSDDGRTADGASTIIGAAGGELSVVYTAGVTASTEGAATITVLYIQKGTNGEMNPGGA